MKISFIFSTYNKYRSRNHKLFIKNKGNES